MASLKILALETSTEACSAALLLDGDIQERFEIAPRGHGDLILQMAEELLSAASLTPRQLSAIAFGRGPGAFTGVRIATSVAQGIALGAELPVVPVSTLAALAQGAYRCHGHTALLCAIDARMGEIYWGGYRIIEGMAQAVADEAVCPAAAAPAVSGGGWQGIGTGWQTYSAELMGRYEGQAALCDGAALPSARDIAGLALHAFQRGEAVNPEDALPLYLRDNVVTRP